MKNSAKKIKPPSGLDSLREFLAPLDMAMTPAALLAASAKRAEGTGKLPVIVMPGFGADDYSTAPLRYFLKRHGYKAEGWGIGRNTGGEGLIGSLHELSDRWTVDRNRPHNGEGDVPALCDKMRMRVERRVKQLGSKVVLVGWSLGGYVAREVARDLPKDVAAVVTMGSPVIGGPKYTAAARVYQRRNCDLDWIEAEVNRRYETPILQPITAIYSRRDGIVAWESAIDHYSPNVRHIEVRATHLGLGFNARVWRHVLEALGAAH